MVRQELFVDIEGIRRQLDQYQNENIEITFSISDIRDLQNKNASFSKTIKLPGTSNNKLIFEFISQLTSENNFNPNLKSKTYLLSDSVVVFEGNLQLKNVIPNFKNNIIDFEVVIYSEADSLFKNIGERYLTDLDLSEYNHLYTTDNVVNSWTAPLSNGYFYPLIDYGNSFTVASVGQPTYSNILSEAQQKTIIANGGTAGATGFAPVFYNQGVVTTQMYPSIYLKTIIDRIFYENYFQYKSDFFESDFFKKLIIPFNNNVLKSSEEVNNDELGYNVSDIPIGITGGTSSRLITHGYKSWHKFRQNNYVVSPIGTSLFNKYYGLYVPISIEYNSIVEYPGFISTSTFNGDLNYRYSATSSFRPLFETDCDGIFQTYSVEVHNGFIGNENAGSPQIYTYYSNHNNQNLKQAFNDSIQVIYRYKNNTNFIYPYSPQVNFNIDFATYSFSGTTSPKIHCLDIQWWRSFHPINGLYGATSSKFYLVSGFNNKLSPYPGTLYKEEFGFSGIIQGDISNSGGTPQTVGGLGLALSPAYNIDTDKVYASTTIGKYKIKFKDWRMQKTQGSNPTLTGQTDPIWNNFKSDAEGYIYLQPGEESLVTMMVTIVDSGTITSPSFTNGLTGSIGRYTSEDRNYLSSNISNSIVPYGGVIDAALNLPKNIKQKDFLVGILKMFNLYIEPIKEYNNVLRIEPRDDYYRTGKIKDWTYKVDLGGEMNIQILAETQNKTNLLTYKEDKDYYNSNYKSLTSQIYGQYTHEIDNDFINGVNKIESLFSPTPLINIPGCIDFPIPIISRELAPGSNVTYNKVDSNIRILQRFMGATHGTPGVTFSAVTAFQSATFSNPNMIITSQTSFFYQNQSIRINGSMYNDGDYIVLGTGFLLFQFTNLNKPLTTEIFLKNVTFTDITTTQGLLNLPSGDRFIFNGIVYGSYPYAGHFDNPYVPINDLNFGGLVGIFYPFKQDNLTYNNIYNTYWKKFLQELSDTRSRLLTVDMNLTPEDIYNFSFADTIFLSLGGEDAYYKVNNIEGYDPSGEKTCKVELLKSIDFQIPRSGDRYDIIRDYGYEHRNNIIGTYSILTSTTTTTTTLPPDPATASLTFFSYQSGIFNFILSDPIPSTDIIIIEAYIIGSTDSCATNTGFDEVQLSNFIEIPAGLTSGSVSGLGIGCSIPNYQKVDYLVVNGNIVQNGQIIIAGGTTITIIIDTGCQAYIC